MSFNLIPMKREKVDGKVVWMSVFSAEETEYYQYDAAAWENLAREPERNPGFRADLELNLSCRNMRLVMEDLGFEMSNDGVVIEVGQFIEATSRWMTRHLDAPSAAVADIKVSPRLIDCGRPAGYLNDKISRSAHIAVEGRRRGATHVCVS